MLRITSLTQECCGNGRDQLVYNLQFTGFASVLDAAISRIGALPVGTRLTLGHDAYWLILGSVDSTHHRTLRPGNGEPPVVVAEYVTRDWNVISVPVVHRTSKREPFACSPYFTRALLQRGSAR